MAERASDKATWHSNRGRASSRKAARDSLATYRKKRDFARTEEPAGVVKTSDSRALAFVVQRHHASHLHFDFRLELDGVLKSWAIPKGPSLDPSDKRLAVEVEDHPFDYGGFEGSIPHGEYGGGYVLVWDKGVWIPEGDPHVGLKKGHLKFTLKGDRLGGTFSLVRLRPRGKEKRTNWLLIKGNDSFADTNANVAEERDPPPLARFSPQLAQLHDELPKEGDWGFEIKFDGYRALASVNDGEVTIVSRNQKDWSGRFTEIQKSLAALDVKNAVFDGEICALDEKGRSRFQLLQGVLSAETKAPLVYFLFDLLFIDGFDVRDRPLAVRKAMLQSILEGVKPPLAYVSHIESYEEASAIFGEACNNGLEGLIAKRLDQPHRSGRGPEWWKVKCSNEQEFVIVGYTPPGGQRSGFGALLLGAKEKGKLRYKGKVGTGFSGKVLSALSKKLRAMRVADAPVVDAPRMRDATWVKPSLVAQISFTEETTDGRLRHPAFLGLREDKEPSKVVMEEPMEKKKPERGTTMRESNRVANVLISHPDREIDPSHHLTKLALAEYMGAVAAKVLPYAEKRPLALVRCTDTIGKECFFQKRKAPGMPASIHASKAHDQNVLYTDSIEGLVALVQFGAVELHGWGSRFPKVTKPDWIVMDLDPDESLPFSDVASAALHTREVLKSIGLTSFVKTTGGKGLHVVAPILPEHTWKDVKALAQTIAVQMERDDPKRYISTMTKRKRQGKIFVDYLRNGEGATAVLPYSPRNREGLPVAWPISWNDLRHISPAEFTIETVPALLKRQKRDPWGDFFSSRASLPHNLAELIHNASAAE